MAIASAKSNANDQLLNTFGPLTGQLHRRAASLCAVAPLGSIRKARIRCLMLAVWQLIDKVIGLYMLVVFISVVLTWLVQFKVVNTSNQMVYMIGDFLYRITEPLLKRIRSVVPAVGGIDLSPLILLAVLWFVQRLIQNNLLYG